MCPEYPSNQFLSDGKQQHPTAGTGEYNWTGDKQSKSGGSHNIPEQPLRNVILNCHQSAQLRSSVDGTN